MSLEIGNFVSFFSLEEDFKHVNQNQIDEFVDNCTWYEVEDVGDNWLNVRATNGVRTIPVENVFNEYQVYTKEKLREHLKTLFITDKHAVICAKIRQLYNKQQFKFKGV